MGLPHARAMSSVDKGVYELRVRDGQGIYRVFYLLKSEDGIFVFHAFTKKTQATPRTEIELGRKRLLEMLRDEKKK